MIRIQSVFLLAILFAVFVVTACGGIKEDVKDQEVPINLTISAAASLKDVAEEIKDSYTRLHPEITITYNFAASGTLQRQIEEGAPVDIFISAGQSQMDALSEKDLMIESTRRDLLGNDLVLIAGSHSKISGFGDLIDHRVTKISIGTPESVPAGKYAKEVLTTLNIYNRIQPKLVLAKDVRQVLTYVETGNVDAGLVYRSDATISDDVKIVAVAPPNSHKSIVYPMAIVKSTKHFKQAEKFAAYLAGKEAAGIFIEKGFQPLNK